MYEVIDSEKDHNIIIIKPEQTIKCSGYNVYQGGYGYHSKSKKQTNKKNRKAIKQEIKQFIY